MSQTWGQEEQGWGVKTAHSIFLHPAQPQALRQLGEELGTAAWTREEGDEEGREFPGWSGREQCKLASQGRLPGGGGRGCLETCDLEDG